MSEYAGHLSFPNAGAKGQKSVYKGENWIVLTSAGGRTYGSSLRMKAKLAGALVVVALRHITAICSRQTQPRDSGKRRTTHSENTESSFLSY